MEKSNPKTEPLKIVKLEVENVKRIHAVRIEPDGSDVVIIGGRNAQGKSSVLDSIEMAIGGKRAIPPKPVREGEESAQVVCDLGELIIRRTFTPDGKTAVTVSAADGASYKSPQAILDSLVGRLSFDPLDFTRLDPGKRLELIRELAGLDLSDLDRKRAIQFKERADINRDVASKQGQLDGLTKHADVPEEEVSVSALVKELEASQAAYVAVNELDDEEQEAGDQVVETEIRLESLIQTHKKIAQDIETAEELLAKQRADAEAASKLCADATEALVEQRPIRERLEGAEDLNRKVRENASRETTADELNALKEQSADMTEALKAIDADKLKAVSEAEFPIEGLSLGDDGVSFEGIPFEQASSAQQLRVSVAIGIAMNPKLRVLLIRTGSLLDEDSMRLLSELAREANSQFWVEVVGASDECTVVIEDGSVVS